MALRKWNINAMYWSTNNTRSKHAQTLCGDTKCSGILSGSCEFSVTKILLRLTGTHMQVMRQRYRLQSHHLDSIFRCDHQQDREQGMCHCSATAGPALYFEYYERSVWSVFGGLIIDNKYIYICPVSSLSHLWNSNPYQQAPEKVWNEVLTRNVDKTSADWRHATDLICWSWESTN